MTPSEVAGDQRPDITIILPAFNEAEAIKAGNPGLVFDWAANAGRRVEIIVADDGSTDGTGHSLTAYPSIRVLTLPHRGKAHALVAGAMEANGRYVLFCDMDLSTPIDEVAGMLEKMEAGADVVIGCRGYAREGASVSRRALSIASVCLRRFLIGLPYRDTQCGFKLYRREAVRRIVGRLRLYGNPGYEPSGADVGSGFDIECLLLARRFGLVVAVHKVHWRHRPSGRVRWLKDAWRGLTDLLRLALLYGRHRMEATPMRESHRTQAGDY